MIQLLQSVLKRASRAPLQQYLERYCPFHASVHRNCEGASEGNRKENGRHRTSSTAEPRKSHAAGVSQTTKSEQQQLRQPDKHSETIECTAVNGVAANACSREASRAPKMVTPKRRHCHRGGRWRSKHLVPCKNESVAKFVWASVRKIVGHRLLGKRYSISIRTSLTNPIALCKLTSEE